MVSKLGKIDYRKYHALTKAVSVSALCNIYAKHKAINNCDLL